MAIILQSTLREGNIFRLMVATVTTTLTTIYMCGTKYLKPINIVTNYIIPSLMAARAMIPFIIGARKSQSEAVPVMIPSIIEAPMSR